MKKFTKYQQDFLQAVAIDKRADALVYSNKDSAKTRFRIALEWAKKNNDNLLTIWNDTTQPDTIRLKAIDDFTQ